MIPMSGLMSLLMPPDAKLGFAIKGLDGRYRLANRVMEELLCQDGEHLAGKSEQEILPPPACRLLEQCDQRIVAGEPSAAVEMELTVAGQLSHCLWLRLPILGPKRELQAIASLLQEAASPQQGFVAAQEELASLQEANRQLQQTVAELEQVASTDKLTGVWNRRHMEESLHQEMERQRRYRHPLSLLILDIDFFKQINDQHGHAVGDCVLRRLAEVLQGQLRSVDSLCRWGGEEFIVLCPSSGRSTAAQLAERLRRKVAETNFPSVGRVTTSIGVAECQLGESWEEWFARTDMALYQAKSGGRNAVQVAPETRRPDGADDDPSSSLVHLVWHPAYESGNDLIDRGHQQLFADANELLSAMLAERPMEQVNVIVDRLFTDILQHFRDEEAAIEAAGFPAATQHASLHRNLVGQAGKLVEEYRNGRQGVGDVFQFLAYDVVTKHMLGADRLFFDHLAAQPVPFGPVDE
ncbi:MAG: diguanylate cyclase [Candidatus Accumulibacter sp.]|nr:diguanylate cyclase [Accumulibacter sp.]